MSGNAVLPHDGHEELMRPTPVIGIAGQPGAGKTTLTKWLQRRLGAPALHYDDFEMITAKPQSAIQEWVARGSNYDEIELRGLETAIEAARKAEPPPKFVLLDTLLGRAHRATGASIDYLVWIDTPADIALARKLAATAAKVLETPEEAPKFAAWVNTYLGHYQRFIADQYALQRERVPGDADLVLDGRAAPETLGEQVLSAIEARRKESADLHRGTVQPPLALSRTGAWLLSAIEALDQPFGLERSVKISHGGLNEDRFIASLHKAAFGAEPRRALHDFARRMLMSEPLLDRFLARLNDVQIVHFGFEGPDTVKLYFEFGAAARAAGAAAFGGRQLIHLAAKWRPSDPGNAAVSRYFVPAGERTRASVVARLGHLFEGSAGLPSVTTAMPLIEATLRRCADNAVIFVEVEDEATPRRSFDLNIYAADLTVSAVEKPLRALMQAYGFGPETADPLFARIGRSALGHLSGGFNRSGAEFATIYYGIEPRRGIGRG